MKIPAASRPPTRTNVRPAMRLGSSSPSPLNGERAGVRGEIAAGLRNIQLSAVLVIVVLLLITNSATSAPQVAWERRYNFGFLTRTNQVVAMMLDNAGDIIIACNRVNASGDRDNGI